MSLTSKQRAKLRGQANQMETIFQVGKGGVTPVLIAELDQALAAREMIKLRVLENAESSPKAVAAAIATPLQAEVVQVIGSRIVLFRRNPKEPIYQLD